MICPHHNQSTCSLRCRSVEYEGAICSLYSSRFVTQSSRSTAKVALKRLEWDSEGSSLDVEEDSLQLLRRAAPRVYPEEFGTSEARESIQKGPSKSFSSRAACLQDLWSDAPWVREAGSGFPPFKTSVFLDLIEGPTSTTAVVRRSRMGEEDYVIRKGKQKERDVTLANNSGEIHLGCLGDQSEWPQIQKNQEEKGLESAPCSFLRFCWRGQTVQSEAEKAPWLLEYIIFYTSYFYSQMLFKFINFCFQQSTQIRENEIIFQTMNKGNIQDLSKENNLSFWKLPFKAGIYL